MNGFEIVQILFSTGIAGSSVFLIFRSGRLLEKITTMCTSINQIETDVKEIRNDLSDVKVRLGKLEQKNQDDFQSEIKLLLREKK